MRKLLLSLAFGLGLLSAAQAQVPCIGISGVNSSPQIGITCAQEPAVVSYSASSVSIVPAASATDLICVTGAANIVIRMQRIVVSGSAGTAVGLPVSITKNALADTAGTQATGTALPVAYPLDSTNAAAKATFQANTTNPTINDTSPGIIGTRQLNLPTTAAGSGSGAAEFNWSGLRYSQAPLLRGVAQQVCVNLNGVSVTSGKVNADFWWTESVQ